jgi:hypothetical protein
VPSDISRDVETSACYLYAERAAMTDCLGSARLVRNALVKSFENRSDTSLTLSQFCLFADCMRSREMLSASKVAAAMDSKL